MMPFTPIQFELSAFNCPLCGAFSQHFWSYAQKFDKKKANMGAQIHFKEYIDNLVFSQCNHCKQHTVWLENERVMVYPTAGSAPLANSDLPDNIKPDFDEARNIVELSPRGATALLRLAVQKLCKHLGEKGENINKDIGNLVKKGLPEKMQKVLDSVRVVGNNAVHPGQIDLTDDRETAYKLFGFINIITDIMITQPKQIDDFYDFKIPDKDKIAIDKRDQKTN
ncbi:hypothetical protein A5893_04540 [Pedobacter psychrophilus]|uniref:DUF4145 domain-containing protein n=1 Tax=Pedobacter psychrophilus TaxID=1826909 RepID=A0A179DNM1_9SPHI|nr:DUF4145 domain-containing protein [Pedobacter psychrophilus]OAQ42382.1 hypothetical protein A5893_04540 [Pedobacter psychrophilus]